MAKDKPKGGLGKGLDILFGDSNMNIDSEQQNSSQNSSIEKTTHENVTELHPKPDESVLFLPINGIKTNPFQPRKEFEQSALEELAESIRQKGVIQAITVRKLEDGTYELISGERRLRASAMAGIEKIPAYIMDVSDKEDLLEIALIENIQRKDLNAIEVAEGYQRLINECSLTQEQVADKVSKSRSAVTNFLRMLKLPDEIKESIRKGDITEGHARAILGLNDEIDQLCYGKRLRVKTFPSGKQKNLLRVQRNMLSREKFTK